MASDINQPTASLAKLPSPYGEPQQPLAWETVRAELESTKQYWLSVMRIDGPPHVRPLDGLWLDDVWYYGGSPETGHIRTVMANPQATLHLPDPWRAVIVEGEVVEAELEPELTERLMTLNFEKYPEYGKPDPSHYVMVRYLRPHRAYAWTSFPTDVTKFTFD